MNFEEKNDREIVPGVNRLESITETEKEIWRKGELLRMWELTFPRYKKP